MKKLLLSIIGLLWCSSVLATTTVTQYFNEGGAYSTLSACVGYFQTNYPNFTSGYSDINGVCQSSNSWSSADTTAVTISGLTTDATHTFTIQATGSARHSGRWSTTAYRLVAASDPGSAGIGLITLLVGNATIDGLQAKNTITGGLYSCTINMTTGATAYATIKNNILVGGRRTVKIDNTSNFYLINNVIYGGGVSGVATFATGNYYIYSNTIISTTYGILQSSGTVVAKNNYCSAGTGAISGTITQTTNASSDTTATGTALDNIDYNTTNFTNVTSGSEDLHLPLGSALINVGTDTSGESSPLNFTTDIDGTTRTGTWDIGADEYVSAGVSIGGSIIRNQSVINGVVK